MAHSKKIKVIANWIQHGTKGLTKQEVESLLQLLDDRYKAEDQLVNELSLKFRTDPCVQNNWHAATQRRSSISDVLRLIKWRKNGLL